MVKALHRAGIEVILDVVYNHTAEGGADGPTLSLPRPRQRHLLHPRGRPAEYADYTGCGNTLERQRIDRAAPDPRQPALLGARDARRRLPLRPRVDPVARRRRAARWPRRRCCRDIESDPVLAALKLIAEAWDAGGLYQVGSFVGDRWKEWNGRFRDDVRAFVKGDRGTVRRARVPADRQPGPLRARATASRSRASTSSPATTASR